ncbi:MAG: hypothetical protein SVK08_00030 [Halobacteriota archaeon]|nr:hypothetical protein [Halobacteriota archaeon]
MKVVLRRNEERSRIIYVRTKGGNFQVNLHYSKGGFGPLSDGDVPRGYWISAVPCKITERNESRTIQYNPTSGVRELVEGAKRFSKKRLDELEEEIMRIDGEMFLSILKSAGGV